MCLSRVGYIQRSTAVSYTHLDVYKRQAPNSGNGFLEKVVVLAVVQAPASTK